MDIQPAIAQFIEQKTPFSIVYVDAKGAKKTWTIQYAQVEFYEEKPYLDAWCEESQEYELPELSHNACFRLDRIETVEKSEGVWRESGLDTVRVRVAFYGKSAVARVLEITDGSIELLLKAKEQGVVETFDISNTFWLFRKVLKYGELAEILEPVSLRTKMREKLTLAIARYDDVRPTK